MLILPNFLRLDGAVQFYAALAFGLILMTLAFYFLTKSLNVVLKAVGLYVALFLLLFLGFSRVIFLDSLLTSIILPFFMVLLILLIVLSKFRKSENITVAGIVSLTILVSFLVFMAFLGYAAHQHYTAKYIHVGKLEVPEYYVNLTNKIDDFPSLQRVNLSQNTIDAELSAVEMTELEKIASEYTKPGDTFFYARIDGNYFKVWPIRFIGVEFLTETPENYTVADEEELKCCPTLVKLMDKAKGVEKEIKNKDGGIEKRPIGEHFWQVSPEEIEKVKSLIEEKGDVLEFEGDYFIVFVDCSVRMKKVVIPECSEVTGGELQAYPALKKALISADEEGSAVLKASPEEWSRTMSFIKEKGCIRFNGSNFAVQFMLS